MPDFGLGVSAPILPWWHRPQPGLGRFDEPAGISAPTPLPLGPTPLSFVMVKPLHISFENWAATLAVDFQSDFVPVAIGDNDWRRWAWNLIQSPTFWNQNAPFPDERYENWRAWAEALYDVMVPSNLGTN